MQDTLDKLSVQEVLPILSTLSTTVEYISRENEESKAVLCQSLGKLIHSYGLMLLNSWEMKFNTTENSQDYLKFLKNYEKSIDLINKHKEALLNKTFEFFEGDDELIERFKKLISNN